VDDDEEEEEPDAPVVFGAPFASEVLAAFEATPLPLPPLPTPAAAVPEEDDPAAAEDVAVEGGGRLP